MFQSVGNAVANGFRDLASDVWPKGAPNGIATQRKRQSSLLLPPNTKIDHLVQTLFREEKLSFVDEQASFDKIVLDGINDLVKRHHYGLKVRLEEFQGEIRGSLQARNSNALAPEVLGIHGFGRNDDGTVAFTETGAAIEENIFVAKPGVCSKTNRRNVIRFSERRFVERLNVRKNVCVFVAWR